MTGHRFEVIQELSITGSDENREKIRQSIIQCLTGDWRHAPDKEAMPSQGPDSDDENLQILYAGPFLPHCQLSLWGKDYGYKLTNIIPTDPDREQITITQYNQILQAFYKDVVQHVTEDGSISVEISEPTSTIERWISTKAAKALERFSSEPNRKTGLDNPYVKEKWYEFVASAYSGNSTLPEPILEEWLKRDGWDDDHARQLVLNYIDALSLLNVCDKYKGVGQTR